MHRTKFTNSNKVEPALEIQQSDNLWSAIPDTEAEQVGGGQFADLGGASLGSVSPLVGSSLENAMMYAGSGTALGMDFAQEGMLAGFAMAEAMAPLYGTLIAPQLGGLTGSPQLGNFPF